MIRFCGMAGEDSLKRYTEELNAFISAKNLTPLSAPTYAFYNPPWTLPFLRRNEVMVEGEQREGHDSGDCCRSPHRFSEMLWALVLSSLCPVLA